MRSMAWTLCTWVAHGCRRVYLCPRLKALATCLPLGGPKRTPLCTISHFSYHTRFSLSCWLPKHPRGREQCGKACLPCLSPLHWDCCSRPTHPSPLVHSFSLFDSRFLFLFLFFLKFGLLVHQRLSCELPSFASCQEFDARR